MAGFPYGSVAILRSVWITLEPSRKKALLGVSYFVFLLWQKSSSVSVRRCFAVFFCRIIRSLPTSVPAYSVNRLLGNRTTDTKLLFSINALRIGSFFGLFKTP